MNAYIALITILTVALMFGTAFVVGRARGKYGIKAPATTGHEGFERAFRVQMNTQESVLMFLPSLWTAAAFGVAWLSAVFGAVWLVGRIWYAVSYSNPAGNRGPGFLIGMVAVLCLVVQALWGIAWTFVLA
ncbi:MAPEG family protein [Arenimonas alkanexedens]